MRLTLRTLLAYLDEILEPADAEQLGDKIRSNPHATDLMHRIRECIGHNRIVTPAVDAAGLAVDANSVAEYLDNTLPVEQMPEFEKACLESDVHLSEVAACHQILTMVLGEPAEVDQSLRDHVYRLREKIASHSISDSEHISHEGSDRYHRIDRAHAGEHVGSSSSGEHTTSHTMAAAHYAGGEVDAAAPVAYYDAADSPRSFVWPVAMLLLAGFLTTAAALIGYNWMRGDRTIASAEGQPTNLGPPTVPSLIANPNPTQNQPANGLPAAMPLHDTGGQINTTVDPVVPNFPPPIEPLTSEPTVSEPVAIQPILPDLVAPMLNEADVTDLPETQLPEPSVATAPITPPVAPLVEPIFPAIPATSTPSTSAIPPSPMTDILAGPAVDLEAGQPNQPNPDRLAASSSFSLQPGDALLPPATNQFPVAPAPPSAPAPTTPDTAASSTSPLGSPEIEWAQDNLTSSGIAANGNATDLADPPAQPEAIEAIEKPVKEEPPQDVARSVVEDQALAVWDETNQSWKRVSVREPLRVGQRFRNLPMFRPQLLLVGGLQMKLAGSAEFTFGKPAGVDTAHVQLSNGRVDFAGMGQAPSQVELGIGNRTFTVRQDDPNSDFFVDVMRIRTPGSDPATANRHYAVRFVPLSGRIGISEGDNDVTVDAGQAFSAVDNRAAQVVKLDALKHWSNAPVVRDIDRNALLEFEPLLSQDKSLTLSLLEAAKHRRTDIRSLAARCLASMGRYEPLIASLGDRKQHAHWPVHVQQIQSAIDQHPDSSEMVARAIRRVTGPDAEIVLRALRGYDPVTLAEGGAEQLIRDLENESIEVRVVAIETLKKITGMSQLFRAEQPAARRQVAVKKWRGRLAEGEIGFAVPPMFFQDAAKN